jgi:hypothetical protein
MTRILGRAGRLAIVGLVMGAAIFTATSPIGPVGLGFIPYACVGALIIIRRPRTSIGWILLGMGMCYALISRPVEATAQEFADGTVDLPVALFAIVHSGMGTTVFFLYAVLAMVFPSGRLPTGRWGRLGRAGLAAGLLLTVAAYVMPFIYVGYPTSVPVPNPVALLPDLAIWRVLTPTTVVFPVMVLVIAAAVSLVVRVRRARGTERQQLRWIAASIAVLMAAVVSGFVIGSFVPDSSNNGLAWIPAIVAFPSVPISIGIAVLRYRLYEIDRIISRTLSWALMTALLGAVFVGLVVGLQALSANVTSGNTLTVAASTLVVAALFQPLRRRVQGAVDRRFNRATYDAQRTAEGFAEQLRNEVDLARLRVALVDTVEEAVRPVSASIWLRSTEVGR